MGHFNRVYNYVPYRLEIGISDAIRMQSMTLLPGEMNFILKAGTTLSVGGLTTNCGFTVGFPMNPNETINSDGAANLWVASPEDGVAATAYILVSRSQGFEGQ